MLNCPQIVWTATSVHHIRIKVKFQFVIDYCAQIQAVYNIYTVSSLAMLFWGVCGDRLTSMQSSFPVIVKQQADSDRVVS